MSKIVFKEKNAERMTNHVNEVCEYFPETKTSVIIIFGETRQV